MGQVYPLILGCRPLFYLPCQVIYLITHHFISIILIICRPIPGFLSHPQTVYPSYLTPQLNLTQSNLTMNNLGQHSQNMTRISPQSMATISQQLNSQNMRITSPHLNSINSISPSSQNLSISPSQLNGRPSPGQNLTNPNPNSPGKIISRTGSIEHPDICESPGASTANLTNTSNNCSSKENPLNMSMNNSDMRSNSIAALRIKAKEHLESMSKGLTIV